MTIINLIRSAYSLPYVYKTPREKEKLLIMSNFSFSHSVFKTVVHQTHKNHSLLGKGLKTLADENLSISVIKMMVFVDDWVEKNCGNRTAYWLPAFPPLPTMFSMGFFWGSIKLRIVL